MVARVQSGDVNLLIGTQIVAKGYHFPDLTFVGVVDADLGLFGGDPRAAERTFQMMHQVAGRAGRAEKKGRVLLQTHDPNQAVMQALASGDRGRFIAEEADNRSRGGLPPYGRMVALIVSGSDLQVLDNFCLKLKNKAPEGQDYRISGSRSRTHCEAAWKIQAPIPAAGWSFGFGTGTGQAVALSGKDSLLYSRHCGCGPLFLLLDSHFVKTSPGTMAKECLIGLDLTGGIV